MKNIIEPNTKFTPSVNSKLEPQIDWARASVILGRGREAVKELGLEGTMNLGVICEHQTTGASLFGYKVLFDNQFPHIIFVCGKRGSGKSYTLGVIVEELGRSNTGIGTVVVDPLGTFWTMNRKNTSKKASQILSKYGLYPKDFNNTRVLAPIGYYEEMKSSVDGAFSIAVSDLSVDDWCLVFGINRFKTQGLLIGDVLDKINNGYDAKIGDVTKKIPGKRENYTIGDIIFCTQHDVSINSTQEGYALSTRRSVVARFRSAAKWGIFSVKGTPINQISKQNKITILDVSHSQLGSSRRALIVGIVSRKILEARIESSRKEEASSMGLEVSGKELIPVTWLIIDEAHLLLPASGKTPATESLIEYAKLGRSPGCGLVFATQRPAATNDEILSQVDTIIGHNLALEDDISALRRRIPAKMPNSFNSSDFIRGIPVGVCLLADQKTQQRTMLVQIRPRMTHHSGRAAIPKSELAEAAAVIEQPELLTGKPEELEAGVGTEIEFEAEVQPEPELNLKSERESDIGQEAAFTDDIMKPTVDVSEFIAKTDLKDKAKPGKKVEKPETEVDTDKQRERREILKALDELRKHEAGEIPAESSEYPGGTEIPLEESEAKVGIKPIIGRPGKDIDLDWGGAYIIITKGSDFALKLFEKYAKLDSKNCLSISRTHPKKLDGITENEITNYWLSKTPEKNSVSPGNITKLAYIISEQLKNNDKSVIFLDGLEYLISNNDFPKIMKFIETVHEKIVLNNGILLVPLNPSTMQTKDFELLENELVNTIKDPILGGVITDLDVKTKREPGTPDQVAPEPSGAVLGTTTTRTPTIDDLKTMCTKLGLPTTGSVSDLKKRLLEYDVETEPPLKKPDKVEVEKKTAVEKAEDSVISSLEKERQALIAERKKLKAEMAKLKELAMKRKVESEKEKLKRAKKLLEERQKKLENKLQKLAAPPR
ncbi:helicase HerA-like domain-containing protein, partial [[Eubacterium] cellulosolvens]